MVEEKETQEYRLDETTNALQTKDSILLPNDIDDWSFADEQQAHATKFSVENEEINMDLDPESCHVTDIRVDEVEINAIKDIIESTLHLSDPFQVPSEVFIQMKKLAVICFQLKVHGNPSAYLRSQQDNSALNTTSETYKVPSFLLSGMVKDSSDGKTKTVHGMEENNNSYNLEEDKELGQIVKRYFYLYRDSIAEIIGVIEKSKRPNDERWEAILQCLTGISFIYL